MNKILFCLTFFSTIAISAEDFKVTYPADLPNEAIEISHDENGELLRVTVNRWTDRVKTDEGMAYRTFEQGYDYSKKQGFIYTFDENDNKIGEAWSVDIDGMVTREELMVAFDLFKNNETVKNHFSETDMQIILHGGFNFQDNSECNAGNRCVHVFASTDKVAILAHSIVRLSDSTVVYPDFDMDKEAWKNGKRRGMK